MKEHKYKCVICRKESTGWGNNPMPVMFHGRFLPKTPSLATLLKSSYSARNVFSLARIALRLSPFAFCSFMLAIRTFSFCLTVWFISLRTWDNFMYCSLFSSPASFIPLRTALRLPILTFKSCMFFVASPERSFRSITTCLVDVTPDALIKYRVLLCCLHNNKQNKVCADFSDSRQICARFYQIFDNFLSTILLITYSVNL